MTKEQFFSEDVGHWVVETNKKYPNLTVDEFCKMFEEWFEKNENSIKLNESIDLSKYSKLDEKRDIFDDDFDDDDFDDDDFDDDDVFGDGDDDDDDDDDVFGDKHDGVDDYVDIEPEPITIKPSEEEKELFSKIKGRYLVNNGKDYEHNIFNVVNAWYNECLRNNKKEHELEYSRICLLETSNVENMAALFAFANVPRADLSKWDTSNVVNMEGMFYKSTYDSTSILGWNTGKCINFDNMFVGSKFSTEVKGFWNSGNILETVWNEDGKTPKMEPELDEEGRPTGKTKVVKLSVKAPLPEIGSHVVDINRKKDARILKVLGELEYKEKTTKKEKYMEENKHILTIDEFVNEGLYDKFRRGIKKIKEKFNLFRIKINDYYVATFKKDNTTKNGTNMSITINGDTNIYTTMNYLAGGRVNGVSAFTKIESPLLNPNVESVARIENKGDKYYGFLTKNSREYKNFLYWIDVMEKVLLGGVNEERVSLSAKGSMLDALPDITSDQFKVMLRRIIHDNPAENDINEDSLATFIFGAPGIGKTTIPKDIIKEFNRADENKTKKKSIIVIECGDLELGGFYLPMPDDTDMEKVLKARPGLEKKLLTDYNFTNGDIESMKGVRVLKTEESPKTWLPVYKPSSDIHTQRAQTLVANSGTIKYKEWNDKLEEFEEFVEDTFDGGIIMFDEFLRADEELFKTIMQLITKRETSGGYRIGSKWSIIACSNRPCDDSEVRGRFDKLAPAFGNRMSGGAFNFIPDFNEWVIWAKTSGYFDDDTLAFISHDAETNKDTYDVIGTKGKVQKAVVYKRWHNLDPTKFHNMGPDNRMVFASPRSWANLMLWVHKQIKFFGLDSILDIDPGELKRQAIATIGLEIAEEYCSYMDRIREMGSRRPSTKSLFIGPVNIETEIYNVFEAVKSVENFVRANFKRSKVAKNPGLDEKFLQMAKNLDNAYGDLTSNHLYTLHRNIVVNIFKIRSESFPEDEPLRKNLENYFNFVHDAYGINYADLDK